MDYDCKACGACCAPVNPPDGVPYPPTRGYVDLYPDDLVRLPKARRLDVVEYPTIRGEPNGHRLATKRGRDGNHTCVCLLGQIGKSVLCDIYAQRPSICQAFEPGGHACRKARTEAGLANR